MLEKADIYLMKILYIIDSLGVGGKERQLLELVGELEKSPNYEIVLIVLSNNKHFEKTDRLTVQKHFIERKRRKDVGSFFRILDIARQFEPDIIHSWELMCSIYAAPIAKLTGSRFVNGFVRRAPTAPSLAKPRLTYPFSDRILSNSFAGLQSYKVPAPKACCIHNGFDFNRVTNLEPVEVTRQRLGIRTTAVIGMVARFHPRKHFETLIKSAKEIIGVRDDLTFVLVGDGETLDACRQQADPYRDEQIRFLGSQQDVETLVQLFDIGVLLSLDEGISNTLMEYMAQSKPVIATDHGGNRELVVDGVTGLLVAPGDASAVTNAILRLHDDPPLAKTLGKNGHDRLRSEFSLEKMVSHYMTLYSALQ